MRVEPLALVQLGQVDQQRVAGKCGTAHVRRVARADTAQGQNLPQLLPGIDQPVDEMVGRLAEIARAVRTRQAGQVQ